VLFEEPFFFGDPYTAGGRADGAKTDANFVLSARTRGHESEENDGNAKNCSYPARHRITPSIVETIIDQLNANYVKWRLAVK
jgi:hypothetical protein